MWWTTPDGIDVPSSGRRVQRAVYHGDYHSRFGHRQAGLPAARRRCRWQGSIAAGAATVGSTGFFKALSPCLVGIEACGTAHYWAREVRELGHEVRLMPPSYVVPYVKRGETDAADKEICNCDRAMAVIRCLAQNMWDE